jgi:hypothetical protein
MDSPLEAIRKTTNVGVWNLSLLTALDFKIAKRGPRPASCGTLTVTAGREKDCTADKSKSESAQAIIDVLNIIAQLPHKSRGSF